MFYNSRTDGIFWVNFLQDFQRNGHKFTEGLCLADSDRDGVPNGVELGLNTTRHNIQTLCQFVASYTFNAKLINFLERKSLLGRPIGHPGKKGVSSSISLTEIPCSVSNMYNVSIHGLWSEFVNRENNRATIATRDHASIIYQSTCVLNLSIFWGEFNFFRMYGHAPNTVQTSSSLTMMPLGFEKLINLFLSSSAFFKSEYMWPKLKRHQPKKKTYIFLNLILDALIILSIYNLWKITQNLHNSVIYFSRHLWPEQLSTKFTIPMRTMLNGVKK